MVTPFRYYNLSRNSATMASTTNGTQILPGSNNASTAGRAIDTYDRNFGGIEGNGTDEGVDYEHRHLAQTGQLTESGYHQDGFVVDDQEELGHDHDQPLETLDTVEHVTESRTRTRTFRCCSCKLEDSEDDEPMDSEDDDSDYEDQSSSEDDDTEDDE